MHARTHARTHTRTRTHQVFSTFDWERHALSIDGPVSIDHLRQGTHTHTDSVVGVLYNTHTHTHTNSVVGVVCIVWYLLGLPSNTPVRACVLKRHTCTAPGRVCESTRIHARAHTHTHTDDVSPSGSAQKIVDTGTLKPRTLKPKHARTHTHTHVHARARACTHTHARARTHTHHSFVSTHIVTVAVM